MNGKAHWTVFVLPVVGLKALVRSTSFFFLLIMTVGVSPLLAMDLALIAPAELREGRQAWAILDARPKSDWLKGRVPGAHSFFWEDFTRVDENGTPYRLRPPQELAATLGRMGIDENTPVAVYGDAEKSWGGEGWTCWVLSWLGHKGPIRLLSGGIQSWRAQGYPVSAGPERGPEASVGYQVELRPELDIQTSELARTEGSVTLIDTRSTVEWLMGHLPNAIHIPWTDFHAGKDHRPLDPGSVRKLLEKHRVDTGRPIVYYCAGGVRSGYAWMVHQLAGLPLARNYAGGTEEWKRRSSKVASGSGYAVPEVKTR